MPTVLVDAAAASAKDAGTTAAAIRQSFAFNVHSEVRKESKETKNKKIKTSQNQVRRQK
jgi:hypothetical protein